MIRTYLVPKIGNGSHDTPYTAGYIDEVLAPRRQVMEVVANMRPYGLEPVMLVEADVTEDEHAAMLAHGDVIAVDPSNVPTRKIELLKIPVDVPPDVLIPHLHDLFSGLQRYEGAGENPLEGKHLGSVRTFLHGLKP